MHEETYSCFAGRATRKNQRMNTNTERSIEEAIAEIDRELKVRLRCYPNWIKDGRLNPVDAQDRLDRMSAALAFLKQESLKKVLTLPCEPDKNTAAS
jgi:hypothetical protein